MSPRKRTNVCGLSLWSSSLLSCCYKVVIPVGPGLVRVTKSREQHDHRPPSSLLPIITLPTPVVPIPTEAVPTIAVAVANDATVLIIVVVLGLADGEILTPLSGFLLSDLFAINKNDNEKRSTMGPSPTTTTVGWERAVLVVINTTRAMPHE